MKHYDITTKNTISENLFLAVCLVIFISLVSLTGCKNDSTAPVEAPQQGQSTAELSGGQWKTVLIPPVTTFQLSPPPSDNSSRTRTELNELLKFQAERNGQIISNINYWNNNGIIRWNEIARNLVIKHKTSPPMASRAYALLSVGQYDALIAAWHNKYLHNRQAPGSIDGTITYAVSPCPDPAYPSEHAVIASVSSRILAYLFPADSDSLYYWAAQQMDTRMQAGVNLRSDISAGDSLGALVAGTIINYAKTDGSDAVWTGSIPQGPGLWFSSMTPPQPPLLPMWGKTKAWLMIQPPLLTPPPKFDSPEFKAAVAEVKQISDTRTKEQLRIAEFWSDGAGTSTPPGHWNSIACEAIKSHKLNELRTARALSLMNMAIMDAGICCWDAKYKFWCIRPSQVDTTITTPVGLPNFPSYTSGHSSFSGAAAVVLCYLFPDMASDFSAMAEEAAISRLYGGIHFRFDSEAGLQNGRVAGRLAVEKGYNDGSGY